MAAVQQQQMGYQQQQHQQQQQQQQMGYQQQQMGGTTDSLQELMTQQQGTRQQQQPQQPQQPQQRALPPTQLYDGPTSIRERDAYLPQHPNRVGVPAKGKGDANPKGYMRWSVAGEDRKARPAVFRPTGSFSALKKQGKMDNSEAIYKNQMVEKKSFMPGYTGFVRGMQHISGRTFGEATRRAHDTDYRENLCTSPIPSAPQANRKVRQADLDNTFVTNTFGDHVYQLPGYTGHVPGVRATYAKTYGGSTSQEMDRWGTLTSRDQPQEKAGFAYTQRPRQMLVIDSAPLRGMTKSEKAPEKLIPSHLRYLTFMSM